MKKILSIILLVTMLMGILASCSGGETSESKVEKIHFEKEEITISVGERVTLKPLVYPKSARDAELEWESSNEDVATVSQNGKVEGISEGTVIIAATSNNGKCATCRVNVINDGESDMDDPNGNGENKPENPPIHEHNFVEGECECGESDPNYKTENFDYLSLNLEEYIEFTKDYKNFTINVDIAKPRDIDVEVAILNMLYADRESTLNYSTSPVEITCGDEVQIWYRGYLMDESGNKVEVDGLSNFNNSRPYSLAIGSGNFIPGFEYNLIGKNIEDYSRFNKISWGKLKENRIAYISYTLTYFSGDGVSLVKRSAYERVDLSEDIDAIYGEGFKEALMKNDIGTSCDVETIKNGDALEYRDLIINFATEGEENPIIVEAYFPYHYVKDELRNETAYFEVYVDSIRAYDCPEFTDEYVYKKISENQIDLTLEELNIYFGETLTEKYRSYIKECFWNIYETDYKVLVEEGIFEYYFDIAEVKKYPEEAVQEIYQKYIDEIEQQFISTGGQLYNSSTGIYVTYSTLDAFATAYLGVSTSMTWREMVYQAAQRFVKEKLIIYYIVKAENLVPTDAEFKVEYDKIVQEYVDDYVYQYMYFEGKEREDYTDDEYEELLNQCRNTVISYYGEDVLACNVYYRLLMNSAIEWPEVITLDERRAYPFK